MHHHPAAGPPVVLIHGISSNHRCWDLRPDRSLAVALAAAGYDAWLLDLRGHGAAIDPASPRHGWTIDHYGGLDLARAIDHIQDQTGAPSVAVVGHSMGGLVAAAYHGIHGDDALGALVVVGSPIDFSGTDPLLLLGQISMGAGQILPRFRSEVPARWLAKVPDGIPLHGEAILFNPRNVKPELRRTMLEEIVSPVSREELRHFTRMIRSGRFTSANGRVDYIDALGSLKAPLLVISGAADRIAAPRRVQAWLSASGSQDETYIEAGKKEGMQEDYGHLDLAFGDRASSEIHARIIDWLGAHWQEASQ